MKSFLPLLRWLGLPHASQHHRFSIMVWLSTMASDPDSIIALPILEVLAMSFKSPAMAQAVVRAPARASFYPNQGKTWCRSTLKSLVHQHCRPLLQCPEERFEMYKDETWNSYEYRRQCAWEQASDSAVATLLNGLEPQWPTHNPYTPLNFPSTYIKLDNAMEAVRNKFKVWDDNRLLYEYLVSLEKKMSSLAVQSTPASLDLAVREP